MYLATCAYILTCTYVAMAHMVHGAWIKLVTNLSCCIKLFIWYECMHM